MNCQNLIRITCILTLGAAAFASVNVNAPGNGAVLGSPVNYVASATTGCSKGVSSMGVYVDNQLIYVVNGKTLNTNLTIAPGSHNTVVEEWDYCGGASYTKVAITVSSQSGVNVTSPTNGSGVNSPVNYVATATSTCAQGVASMGVYVLVRATSLLPSTRQVRGSRLAKSLAVQIRYESNDTGEA